MGKEQENYCIVKEKTCDYAPFCNIRREYERRGGEGTAFFREYEVRETGSGGCERIKRKTNGKE